MLSTGDIKIRDPFVYRDDERRCYFLFGTTDMRLEGPGIGFDCWRSVDLENWEGPIPAFRPQPGFWATHHFWAPEVHFYRGEYYMLGTFKAHGRHRGTQVLRASNPEGPYTPISQGPVTPIDWECLDGTLYVDECGDPWMVFCQEWLQVHNGKMWAMRLSEDLTQAAGRPYFLFNASEAPWKQKQPWPAVNSRHAMPAYITDGPWIFPHSDGALLMLWSSMGEQGYAIGLVRSPSGDVTGPWEQLPEPLWAKDGGHGMIFETFEGEKILTFHQPNTPPDERAAFFMIEEHGKGIHCMGKLHSTKVRQPVSSLAVC